MACEAAPGPESPGLPDPSLHFVVPLGLGVEGGSRAAISCNAVLIRFLRPCSAILCDVRLEVRFVDKASG